MTWLEPIERLVERGETAGIRGIPVPERLWGRSTIDVSVCRRLGLICPHLVSCGPIESPVLGDQTAFGRPIAIGYTASLETALERVEQVMDDPQTLIRESEASFLASANPTLVSLTLMALGKEGDFQGLTWSSAEGRSYPSLNKRGRQIDGTRFWIASLGGTLDKGIVVYPPSVTLRTASILNCMLNIWRRSD